MYLAMYTKGQEAKGVWLGTGAERLGLSGEVKENELKKAWGFRDKAPGIF